MSSKRVLAQVRLGYVKWHKRHYLYITQTFISVVRLKPWCTIPSVANGLRIVLALLVGVAIATVPKRLDMLIARKTA